MRRYPRGERPRGFPGLFPPVERPIEKPQFPGSPQEPGKDEKPAMPVVPDEWKYSEEHQEPAVALPDQTQGERPVVQPSRDGDSQTGSAESSSVPPYPPYPSYPSYPPYPPSPPMGPMELATAYVPWQVYRGFVRPGEAQIPGTIFPELARTPPLYQKPHA